MYEVWVRAVETALDGNTDYASVRTLTLDGAVKCVHGKLPPPLILERFQNLQHLSIANIGVSSLEQFPRLRNLQKLILSDNRISGGLEFLVEVGLSSLRDLDLSNNRIQDVNDLRPLAELRIVSLDLYECPVTRANDYRSMVFGLIKSLKYLDKMDADENERPESDDEEEEDEEEEEEDDGDDPGSGEIDGEELPYRINGQQDGSEGVVDVDEEESDADEEEMEITRGINRSKRNGLPYQSNDFKIEVGDEDDDDEDDDDWEGEDDDDDDDDSDNDFLEVIYEEGDEDDLVEVHEAEDSDDEDVVEEDGDEENEDEVDNDEENERTGRLVSTEGVIDGHEQGEDDGDEDDNGETGEDELGVEVDGDFDTEDEEEDNGAGYLVQPVGNVAVDEAEGGSDMDRNGHVDHPVLGEEVVGDEEDEDGEVQELPPSSNKRKRDNEHGAGETKEEDDDRVEKVKSSKHR